MRKIKDVLRLKLDAQLSHERIAASLGISTALVRCNPQASATGPTTAPKPAMASRRGRSERRSAASRSGGWRIARATRAAPAYSSAAVVNAPSPCQKC